MPDQPDQNDNLFMKVKDFLKDSKKSTFLKDAQLEMIQEETDALVDEMNAKQKEDWELLSDQYVDHVCY